MLVAACATIEERRELAWALIQSLGHTQMVDLLQASALEALPDAELLALAERMRLLADSLGHSVQHA